MLLYTAISMGHMLWVKHSIGYQAYFAGSTTMPAKLLVFNQALKAGLIFTVIAVALKHKGLCWQAVGFKPFRTKWLYLAVFLAIAGFLVRVVLAKWMVFVMPQWHAFTAAPLQLSETSIPALSLFLGLTVLVTPVAEEVFFRGFLFQWFASRRPLWLAAIISSVIFGASHIVPAQAISAALMSLIIIYLYVASGSIWPAIICHITNNLFSISANLFPQTAFFQSLTGG
ncbi:hypothetical protein AT746_11615 [Lacimicrobium alkaliphilum]|uniref:CAAX prenyl protease 2/Lysostaphin resistance protein A-like domain-containing protein n=2 Tax=Lacimicrobium alkaliphilum TaxID=1526571 RepID=A0A0U2ZIP0_9ALTE|nr:hypothetical protein AT746_11615 [Lacimicrobium alkaliphilum]